MDIPLDQPGEFDRLAYLDPELRPDPGTPLGILRAAQMAFVRGEHSEMENALLALQGLDHPLRRGLELLLRLLLGDAQSVAREEVGTTGSAPLDWEGTCHTAAAIGIASAIEGQLERAQAHLLLARTLTRGLGMSNREQTLTMEWGRVAALRGQPQPEVLVEQLRTPMPPRRRAWGQRTLAESYMALGCYRDALQALGTPELDTPLDAALRDFLHALMGYPVATGAEPTLPYARLADAVRGAMRGDLNFDLGGIEGQPQQGYAVVLEGMSLANSPGLAQQAVRLLGRQVLAPPDQTAYRLVTLLGAVGDGAVIHPGALSGRETPLLTQLGHSFRALRGQGEALEIIRRASPSRFVLLMFSPLGETLGGVGLAGLPLIAGKQVMCGTTPHPLPGKTGRVAVLRALGLPHEDVTRADRRRHALALEQLPSSSRAVNLGWVARACLRLAEQSLRLGHHDEAAAWRLSYAQVVALLTPDVQEVIGRYPPTV